MGLNPVYPGGEGQVWARQPTFLDPHRQLPLAFGQVKCIKCSHIASRHSMKEHACPNRTEDQEDASWESQCVAMTLFCPSTDPCYCTALSGSDFPPDEGPEGRVGPSSEEVAKAKEAILAHSTHEAEEAVLLHTRIMFTCNSCFNHYQSRVILPLPADDKLFVAARGLY